MLGGTGSGAHPAMVLAHSPRLRIVGDGRETDGATRSPPTTRPSSSKMTRIAAASASAMANIPRPWPRTPPAGKRGDPETRNPAVSGGASCHFGLRSGDGDCLAPGNGSPLCWAKSRRAPKGRGYSPAGGGSLSVHGTAWPSGAEPEMGLGCANRLLVVGDGAFSARSVEEAIMGRMLTIAQEKALMWLPADGSERSATREMSAALPQLDVFRGRETGGSAIPRGRQRNAAALTRIILRQRGFNTGRCSRRRSA